MEELEEKSMLEEVALFELQERDNASFPALPVSLKLQCVVAFLFLNPQNVSNPFQYNLNSLKRKEKLQEVAPL